MSKLGSKPPNQNSCRYDSLVIETMTRLFLVKGEGVSILFLVRVNAESLQLRSIIKAVGFSLQSFAGHLAAPKCGKRISTAIPQASLQ
jgi:hypothetical protein